MGVVNRSPGQNIGRGGHIVNNPGAMAVGLADSRCPRRTCPVTCSRQPAGTSHPNPAPETWQATATGCQTSPALDVIMNMR